jgi:hypothetical protein
LRSLEADVGFSDHSARPFATVGFGCRERLSAWPTSRIGSANGEPIDRQARLIGNDQRHALGGMSGDGTMKPSA